MPFERVRRRDRGLDGGARCHCGEEDQGICTVEGADGGLGEGLAGVCMAGGLVADGRAGREAGHS